MQKIITSFFFLVGLISFFFAGIFIWGAYIYSDPTNIFDNPDKVPLISPIIEMLDNLTRSTVWQGTLKTHEYKYAIPLSIISAVFVSIGLLVMRFAKFKFETGKTEKAVIHKTDVVLLQNVRITDEDVGGDSGIKIDETLLEVEQDEMADYSDINRLIALSHSDLDRDKCILTLKVLRPRLLNYTDTMTEDALVVISRQILYSTVIRHKRREKNITPDQFRRQNENMSKIEQETICRRYLPKKENADKIPPEHKDKIGRVYIVTEQSEIQQELLSDNTDWHDISLSNIVAIMSDEGIIAKPPLSSLSIKKTTV